MIVSFALGVISNILYFLFSFISEDLLRQIYVYNSLYYVELHYWAIAFSIFCGALGVLGIYVIHQLFKKTNICPQLVLYLRIASLSLTILNVLIPLFIVADFSTAIYGLIVPIITAVIYLILIKFEQEWFKKRTDIFKN